MVVLKNKARLLGPVADNSWLNIQQVTINRLKLVQGGQWHKPQHFVPYPSPNSWTNLNGNMSAYPSPASFQIANSSSITTNEEENKNNWNPEVDNIVNSVLNDLEAIDPYTDAMRIKLPDESKGKEKGIKEKKKKRSPSTSKLNINAVVFEPTTP